MTCEDTHLSLY